MSVELVMPRAGLTMVSGTIGEWLVEEGAEVAKAQPIMSFENEKNVIDFESPGDGIIHIVAENGQEVEVGGLIGYLAESKEEYDNLAKEATPVAEKQQEQQIAAPQEKPAVAAVATAPATGRIRASGVAKRIAGEKGVNLALVGGTGPNGRIVKRDVEAYLEAAPTVVALGEPTAIELTGMRRAIAVNMHRSVQEMAQSTAMVEVDVTDLLAMRKRLVEKEEVLGARITVTDLLAKATIKMLKLNPMANSTFDGTTIMQYPDVNLGLAVGAEEALLVPVIKGADKLSLTQLSQSIRDVSLRARDNQLRAGEQSDGTFTLTNVGVFPIDIATPIINTPQVAIAGFGRTVEKPVIYNDEIARRFMMNIFITYDHRVFDGLGVGKMLGDLKTHLENPELILA